MDYINLGAALGIISIILIGYKKDTIKSKTLYLINDIYEIYKKQTSSPDAITNVQIIKSNTSSIDITKTYISIPYNIELDTQDLLKISYSYKGNNYTIFLNKHNSTHFPIYTFSELEDTSPSDGRFTSAIITTKEGDFVYDFTDTLKTYAGPKIDFYKEKSIPFNIEYIEELQKYFNKPYILKLTNIMADEEILDLENYKSINI